MRLVAWNANFNLKKRSLERNVDLLREFSPDVIVLSETAAPATGNPSNALWCGSGDPGLAVIPDQGWELKPDPANGHALPLMAGFRVCGRSTFGLLAIWPAPEKNSGATYHEILMAALEHYSRLLTSGRAVMAGDFNSNTRVSSQRYTHPRFVAAAESRGLVSVYHARSGEQHGNESLATYRHQYSPAHTFHIDYCFASLPIANSANLRIANDDKWASRSDHYPLILDVDDSLLWAK